MDSQYFDKVKEITMEQLGVEADQITEEASFIDDLGADSLDTVELVMALEEHFDIEIPDEEAEKIRTVRDAASAGLINDPSSVVPLCGPRRHSRPRRRSRFHRRAVREVWPH